MSRFLMACLGCTLAFGISGASVAGTMDGCSHIVEGMNKSAAVEGGTQVAGFVPESDQMPEGMMFREDPDQAAAAKTTTQVAGFVPESDQMPEGMMFQDEHQTASAPIRIVGPQPVCDTDPWACFTAPDRSPMVRDVGIFAKIDQ